MGRVLTFERPAPPPDLSHKCSFCNRPQQRRSLRNDPAYCSYECGVRGQPDRALDLRRNNDPR